MPATPHVEKHFLSSATVRDIVIGMSDGLTVPFALAAGLSSTLSSMHLVVTAGGAEIAAGAIAMGLGGYLAARTDREHYESELLREHRETIEIPDEERAEVAAILREYGVAEAAIGPVVESVSADRARWVRFMMRFELGLEQPDRGRERRSAVTIALSYIAGGVVPLWPYLVCGEHALTVSCAVTLVALFVFGGVKGKLTGASPLRAGLQTLLVGGLAAAAAFLLARLLR
ncbi:MAG: VIT1/CCC1 transporter family protein [Polyangia bacterium]